MTVRCTYECNDCGAKYVLQLSGWGCSEFNQGANSKYCKKCAPKHYVPPKPQTWRWVLTDEVTSEQIFAWDKEEREAQIEKSRVMSERLKESNSLKDLYIPFRRSYMGDVKLDGSDYQEAIWSHEYKMVYWIKSRLVDAIYKREKRSKLDMLTHGVLHERWHRFLERRLEKRLKRERPRERYVFTPTPFPKMDLSKSLLFYDYKYGNKEELEGPELLAATLATKE